MASDLIQGKRLDKLIKSFFKNTEKHYFQIIRWLKNISNGIRLLEFGSSWGYFLHQAKQQNFEATGVEISKKRAEFGKKYIGVDIVTDIDKLLMKKKKFDIIFSAHTLEHIGYDIGNIFDKFYNLLAERGIIVIEVPYLNLEKGKAAFKIMGAVHPLGFRKDFFLNNLPKHGFEVKIHYGYEDFIPGFEKDMYSLVVICNKK